MAVAANYDGSKTYKGHGYQTHIDLMKPTSRGSVRLSTANPEDPPKILFNYLQTKEDQKVVVEGFKLARELLAQPSFDQFRGVELDPGEDVASDQEILNWAKVNGETEYHPTSSCTMGRSDSSVVDEELRVHGFENLRIVDASIMPEIVTANTHATTLMIAEKASDLILERPPLTPISVPVFQK